MCIRDRLYKGSGLVVSRKSPVSLYQEDLASFGSTATYDPVDAEGFIRLFGLPIRAAVAARGRGEEAVSNLIEEVADVVLVDEFE